METRPFPSLLIRVLHSRGGVCGRKTSCHENVNTIYTQGASGFPGQNHCRSVVATEFSFGTNERQLPLAKLERVTPRDSCYTKKTALREKLNSGVL